MATFVLVHGAFHGGWCYSDVAERLRARGHNVYTPTLTGLGERAHLSGFPINLLTHVRDIVAVIEENDLCEVILCGHSYGGMVISGAAGQVGQRIRTMVYLDACIPEQGQSLFDLIGPERTLATLALSAGTGLLTPPFPAKEFQGDPTNFERIDKLCTPHPIACFIQKVDYAGQEKRVRSRTFVKAARYKSINEAMYAKVKVLPDWKTITMDCGHEIMIDEPEQLTSILLAELAR